MSSEKFNALWTKVGKHASDFIHREADRLAAGGSKFMVVWFEAEGAGSQIRTRVKGYVLERAARDFADDLETAWITCIGDKSSE